MSPDEGPPARIVSRSGTSAAVAVHGEIDLANAAELRACLTDCLDNGSTDITVDMQGLTFIDSSGLAVLAHVAELAESRGGRLTLQKPAPNVYKVLDITGLSTLIRVTDPDARLEQP
jgi:anti-anti-sigma factor